MEYKYIETMTNKDIVLLIVEYQKWRNGYLQQLARDVNKYDKINLDYTEFNTMHALNGWLNYVIYVQNEGMGV